MWQPFDILTHDFLPESPQPITGLFLLTRLLIEVSWAEINTFVDKIDFTVILCAVLSSLRTVVLGAFFRIKLQNKGKR